MPDTRALLTLEPKFGCTATAGTCLFREGDDADTAYVIVDGRVRVLRRVRATERTVAVLSEGELFGESAWLPQAKRRTTAIAMSDVRLLAIDRARFEEFLSADPPLAASMVETIVRRLGDAEDQLELLTTRDADSKVVAALVHAAHAEQAVVALSPLALSAKVGLDVESVKRTVARLSTAGYVEAAGDKIIVKSLESLRKLHSLLRVKDRLANVDDARANPG